MNGVDKGVLMQLAIIVEVAGYKGFGFTRHAGELGSWAYSRITWKYDDESFG